MILKNVMPLQTLLEIGVNAFAARLLIESFETMPKKIKTKLDDEVSIIFDKTVIILKTIKESEGEKEKSKVEFYFDMCPCVNIGVFRILKNSDDQKVTMQNTLTGETIDIDVIDLEMNLMYFFDKKNVNNTFKGNKNDLSSKETQS